MQNDQQNKTEYGLWLDFPFFFRTLKKWLIAILTLAIAAGCLVYVGGDLVLGDTYTATALVSVVPKNNDTNSISSNNIGNAVTRDVNMWNSAALLKQIQDSNPDIQISGSLTATAVEGTSLVQLTASAHKAKDAYYLLSSAIRNYHQIESSFDNSYVGVMLTRVTADSISVSYVHPLLYAAAGFVLVVFGFMMLLLLWCAFTNVLHKDSQAAEMLAVPLYEALPHVNKKKLHVQTVLITQPNCDMDYIEAMDKLTSRVEQHMQSAKQKVMMVTSIQENEGKSTVAANLALNLARRGRKTVLIDLDFRKPVLYKIFDQEKRTAGNLSEVLKHKAELTTETIEGAYGLNFVWQFKAVRDADRVIEQESFRQLLQKLSERYDYVILDTPPMAPVRDSEVTAQYADCSLLVIRQDYSRASVANDVVDQLDEHGAACIGSVFNNCRAYRRTGSKGYGYHYKYNYRTGEGK